MTGYEIEGIPGLEDSVEVELRSQAFRDVQVVGRPREGRIAIRYGGRPSRLNSLRSAVAVHQILTFGMPRPRGLLGHEHLTRLLDGLERIVRLYPAGAFQTFRVSGAGAESAVFLRIGQEIASRLHLEATPGPAQLQIAVYPAGDPRGWHLSVRLSPAPLSARSWRVCNMPGALNATIANAMVRLAEPEPDDRFLNLCCGSGTLIVERLELTTAKLTMGVDLSSDALACARANVQASGRASEVVLALGDATQLQFEAGSIDTVVADLPYGQLVGSPMPIETLYRSLVAETTRVVPPSGHFVAITTRRRLLDQALDPWKDAWQLEEVLSLKVPFRSGYIQPVVYSLRKVR